MTNNQRLLILIADKDAAFVRFFTERFKSLADIDVSVDACATGTEMMDRLFGKPYDLVFMDMGLPDTDAFSILSRLAHTSLPLPLVVLSSENDARPAVEAMKRGVLDHVMKEDFRSLDLQGLLNRLQETFRLRRENAELQQISQMKNDFLATISHELRTPLTSILGLSEILLTGRMGALVEKQSDSLKKIVEQSQNLARLINQLLEVQEVIQERTKMDFRPLALSDLVDGQVASLQPLFAKKGVQLFFPKPDGHVVFKGHQETLDKVLEHILLNALKFTPNGGAVNVKIQDLGKHAGHIIVQDNGQGIPQEAIPFVFQKFFHADQSLTRNYGGLGLGLAYCKHVIEAHGGRIWVESAGAGKGTTVNVTLPRFEKMDAPSVPGKGEKLVLWADDNPSMLELVECGFAAMPKFVRLVTSRSGQSTLEQIRVQRPDLVVLDIMMPDINGLEVLERLKADPRTKKIPVLVVSGYHEAAREAVDHGASDYFLKPFRLPELMEKIRELLHLPKAS